MTDAVQPHCTRPWYLRPPVWLFGIILAALAVFATIETIDRPAATHYSDFLDQLDADNVASVAFQGTQIDGRFRRPVPASVAAGTAPQPIFRTRVPDFGDPTLLLELRKQHVAIDVLSSSSWTRLLAGLPWPMLLIMGAVLIAALVRFMRGSKAGVGFAMPTHPMMGLIKGLFRREDQATRPPP